jgi:ADP-ribose pyrophosphatase YjhB (NUDIX family)
MTHHDQIAAFCLRCGAELESRVLFGRSRRACPRCEFIFFRNTPSAAGAVVARGRDVLLVRRSIEPGRGRWGFPAGFQDYGETLAETAVREVLEETGLEVRVPRVLSVVHSREIPSRLVNLVVYLGEFGAGELQAADDASDARYFSLDSLPPDLAFDNNREILDSLVREFPEGDIT